MGLGLAGRNSWKEPGSPKKPRGGGEGGWGASSLNRIWPRNGWVPWQNRHGSMSKSS